MSEPNHMPAPIGEAVVAIMAKVRNVEKQGENKFHNYKFARVEDLIFQVQPAMAEAGLVITQDELSHGIEADAVMLATYAFSLSHVSGVTWGPVRQTGMASARNTKGGWDDKALNKCHTAARKYFILGLFQVPAGDLPDADVDADREAPSRGPSAEEAALNMLRGCGNKAMLEDAWKRNKDGWKNLLPRESYAKLIGEVSGLVEKFNAEERKPEPKPVETFDVDDLEVPF